MMKVCRAGHKCSPFSLSLPWRDWDSKYWIRFLDLKFQIQRILGLDCRKWIWGGGYLENVPKNCHYPSWCPCCCPGISGEKGIKAIPFCEALSCKSTACDAGTEDQGGAGGPVFPQVKSRHFMRTWMAVSMWMKCSTSAWTNCMTCFSRTPSSRGTSWNSAGSLVSCCWQSPAADGGCAPCELQTSA